MKTPAEGITPLPLPLDPEPALAAELQLESGDSRASLKSLALAFGSGVLVAGLVVVPVVLLRASPSWLRRLGLVLITVGAVRGVARRIA